MKKDNSANRKKQPFIDNLDEEKVVTTPDLKELAKRASSRIQRDKTWTGHLFSADKGRIHGVLLYKNPLSTIFKKSLSPDDSDSYCEEIDEATQPPENP
jgi:hypothetical protein